MRIIDLQQNSDVWLRWRHEHLGASEVLALTGVVPHWPDPLTPLSLWELKTGRRRPGESSYAMRRGQRLEPIARQLVCEQLQEAFDPLCCEHDQIDYLGASLDGLSPWGDQVLEIKAPQAKCHALALAGEIPPCYYPQIQYQLLVTGALGAWYASISMNKLYAAPGTYNLAPLLWVPRHPAYLTALLDLATHFWNCVSEDRAPDPAVFQLPNPKDMELSHAGS